MQVQRVTCQHSRRDTCCSMLMTALYKEYFHCIDQSAGLLVDYVLSLEHHHISLQNEPATFCTIQWATWSGNAQCKTGKEMFCKQKSRSCCTPTFRNFLITFQLRSNISNTLVSFWSNAPFLDNCHNPLPPKIRKHSRICLRITKDWLPKRHCHNTNCSKFLIVFRLRWMFFSKLFFCLKFKAHFK